MTGKHDYRKIRTKVFNFPQRLVTVHANVKVDELWLRVSDTGPGISEEHQTRLFESLYRHQSGRRFPQGMGLGLTIARDLVAAHHGRIQVESTPGLGSHFTICIPLTGQ